MFQIYRKFIRAISIGMSFYAYYYSLEYADKHSIEDLIFTE